MVLPIVFLFFTCICLCRGYPQQGMKTFEFDEHYRFTAFTKTVYGNSKLFISVNCAVPSEKNSKINISYFVQMQGCFVEDIILTSQQISESIPEGKLPPVNPMAPRYLMFMSPMYKNLPCNNDKPLPLIENPVFKQYEEIQEPPIATDVLKTEDDVLASKKDGASKEKGGTAESQNTKTLKKEETKSKRSASEKAASTIGNTEASATTESETQPNIIDEHAISPQLVLKNEGVYIVYVSVAPARPGDFKGTVDIKLKSSYGYLSAVDWPLLPFYGVMCGIYVLYGVIWLLVSACQWRDLLRIQFWIGGVILLGMLEKAVFYAEYQAINSTGRSVLGAVMIAEVVSCLKRALARMLVIIVSLGFGIVKPRLGPLLHRVVGVGTLYFVLSVFEAYIRVYTLRDNPYRQYLLADMLLAVLDSFICWWIFSSLVQTTRTLRLRRNVVKLSLYRHFTNTLIFAVIASVAFMVWSVTNHKKPLCVTDWKELWVEEAYWRLLFSTILLVIMILWRPTINNQRYAFTPLLDAPDDEEDETVMSDAFDGMKMRSSKNHTVKDNQTKGLEDDLKWVEENIPSTIADVALPSLLDSDEEIMNTKFEISKMN